MTSNSAQDTPDPKQVEVSKIEMSPAEVPYAIRETLIPLHAEELSVSKERVETGRVHVGTVTRTHDELVDEELANERVEIERIPLNKPIDAVPAVRQEGDVTIVPVVEEVLVTKRSLFLKEEIHIRRIHTTERHRETVTLRRQEAVISRLPTKPSPE